MIIAIFGGRYELPREQQPLPQLVWLPFSGRPCWLRSRPRVRWVHAEARVGAITHVLPTSLRNLCG